MTLKIVRARIYLVKIAGRHPVLVELDTDAGVTGVGDAAVAYGTGATAAAGMIKDLLEEIVLGKDPFCIEALWGEMYDGTFWAKGGGPIVFAGISAIEMALWDIKGKALGVPVWELLGGRTRDEVRVYANGWGPLARPVESSPHGNIKHVEGRQIDRAFEDPAVPFFFEEPVDPFDVEALKKVAEHLQLPIATGERLYTRYAFRRIMEQHAVDIVQLDIGNTGGIAETLKIAAMAETYNMRVQPHVCASPVATAAALQVDACIRNLVIQELYPYRVPEHFAIVDHAPELAVRGGRLAIPDRPGLGVSLVRERVVPFLWAECA